MDTINLLSLNGNGFAFHPVSGDSYMVNATAEKIIELMRLEYSIEDIVKLLVEEYDASFEHAYNDLLEFTERLRGYQLIGRRS